MHVITPNLLSIIDKIQNEANSIAAPANIRLFRGSISKTTYISLLGAQAMCVSSTVPEVQGIPPDHLIVAVSNPANFFAPSTGLSNDALHVDGSLNRVPTRYRVIDLAKLYASGEGFIRIPSMAIRIGMHKEMVNRPEPTYLRDELLSVKENLIAAVYMTVVEDEVDRLDYYINAFGSVHTIKSKTSAEVELCPGLHRWYTNGKTEYLGPIADFIFKGIDTLTNDVVLYTDRRDAEKYNSPKEYYAALDAAAKSEEQKQAKELTKLKSQTAIDENASKRETYTAKAAYETGSLGRKGEYEETSHGRNMIIASMAAATAAFGLIAKLGATSSLVDLIVAPSAITGGLVTTGLVMGVSKLLGTEVLKNLLGGIVRGLGRAALKVASGIGRGLKTVVGGAINVVKSVGSAVCSVACGVASRVASFFGF